MAITTNMKSMNCITTLWLSQIISLSTSDVKLRGHFLKVTVSDGFWCKVTAWTILALFDPLMLTFCIVNTLVSSLLAEHASI